MVCQQHQDPADQIGTYATRTQPPGHGKAVVDRSAAHLTGYGVGQDVEQGCSLDRQRQGVPPQGRRVFARSRSQGQEGPSPHVCTGRWQGPLGALQGGTMTSAQQPRHGLKSFGLCEFDGVAAPIK